MLRGELEIDGVPFGPVIAPDDLFGETGDEIGRSNIFLGTTGTTVQRRRSIRNESYTTDLNSNTPFTTAKNVANGSPA